MSEWYCPNCDFKNRDSNKTCISCGTVRPGASVPKPDVKNSEWICPNCNHKNSSKYSKCFSCGSSRYGDTAPQSATDKHVSGKTALICIAVATVLIVGSVINSTNNAHSSVPASSKTQTTYTTSGTSALDNTDMAATGNTPAAMVYGVKGIDISDCNEIKSTNDGKYMLNVTIKGPNSLPTNSLTVRAMHNDIEAILKHMQSCTNLETINIFIEGTFYNAYGEESTDTAMRVTMNYSTLSKINFDGEYWDSSNIPNVADSYWVHSSLQ